MHTVVFRRPICNFVEQVRWTNVLPEMQITKFVFIKVNRCVIGLKFNLNCQTALNRKELQSL